MKARKKELLLLVIVALGLGLLALGYGVRAGTACHSGNGGNANTPAFDMNWETASTDDPSPSLLDPGGKVYPSNPSEGTIDPGKDKNVASSDVVSITSDGINVVIRNGYPCYEASIFTTIENNGTLPEKIVSVVISGPPYASGTYLPLPPALTVEDRSPQALVGYTLNPGGSVQANFWVHVEQIAQQSYTYYFAIRIGAEGDAATAMGHDGTIGFWKDWDKNKTYTRCHIENWLHTISCGHSWNINQLSDSNWWNGPNTIAGMTSCINGASGGTMQQKFLGQYLAQRLNLASGRQSWYASHNITSVSGYGYLLTTNGQTMIADRYHATAREIINSIESKYGKSPTNSQFEVMKNICDALNNVSLP